jgi:uncharacterized membrane protein
VAQRPGLGRLSAGPDVRTRATKPVSPHALGLVAVLMGLAWIFRSTSFGGLTIHWLAAPFALFVLGPRWSIVAALGATLFVVGTGTIGWADVGSQFLFAGALPIGIAWGWLRLVERKLPPHLFVYLFVAVFAGTLLAVFVSGAALRLLASPPGGWPAEIWIALAVVADGEAVSTGLVVTGLAIYRSNWLYTFDPDVYLPRPGPPKDPA